ncbi:MAG: glycine zipper 2TM domain-containing protein, partial [Sphingomicrobium sp.]
GYGGYGYNGYRCGNPAAGAVVGGVAGAVIGNQIADSGHRRYYRRSNDRAAGTLIGGVLGAVVGSAIAQGNC